VKIILTNQSSSGKLQMAMHSYTLKNDPAWLDIPLDTICGMVTLLSIDGAKISVPTANMLAMSSLWRLIVSDLSPTDLGSPFLSFPVKGEVLLAVGEILSKGFTYPQNDAIIEEAKIVLKMMGIHECLEIIQTKSEPEYLEVEDKDATNIIDPCLNESGGNIKLEIVFEFENEEQMYSHNNAGKLLVENQLVVPKENFSPVLKDGQSLSIKDCISNDDVEVSSVLKSDEKLVHEADLNSRENSVKRSYECTKCKFQSKYPKVLQKHMEMHTGDTRYFKCCFCEYQTKRKDLLKIHKRIHTGEKPYVCALCDYRAADHGTFYNHRKMHSGEKPFACEICEYKTCLKKDLIRHNKVHTGEKPYTCKICDFKCAHKGDLQKHQRKHIGGKAHRCLLCNFRTSYADNLRRHSNRMHKEVQ